MLMAAARVNIPAIVISGGPMWNCISCETVLEEYDQESRFRIFTHRWMAMGLPGRLFDIGV